MQQAAQENMEGSKALGLENKQECVQVPAGADDQSRATVQAGFALLQVQGLETALQYLSSRMCTRIRASRAALRDDCSMH